MNRVTDDGFALPYSFFSEELCHEERIMLCRSTGSLLFAFAFVFSGALRAEPVATSPTEPAPKKTPDLPRQRIPGHAILRLVGFDEAAVKGAARTRAAKERLERILDEIGARTGYSLTLLRPMNFGWGLYAVRHREDPRRLDEEETLAALVALGRDPAVAGASEDRVYRALRTPNDPGMPQMWHLDAMGSRAAWDISVGDSGQRIGVIDSGTVRNHEDLFAKDEAGYDFISQPEFSVDGDGRDADYTDPGDGGDCSQGFQPSSWHGSHVAGTILAATNNGVGIAGINWNARLVTARALGLCGNGSAFDILEAMAWLAGYSVNGVPDIGADVVSVINMSLGSDTPCSQAEQDYVSTITAQKGIVFVAAAGNSGNHVPVGSPANCPGAIAVGAHGPGFGRPLTSYSNFSAELDIIAPGGDMSTRFEDGVLSACGESRFCYVFMEGTSMAAPHVTGVVSLMLSVNPSLTPTQVRDLLVQTGESCSGCGGVPAIRADLAVAAAANASGGNGGGNVGGGGGQACGQAGQCGAGQVCLGQNAQSASCYDVCDAANDCGTGAQCYYVDSALAVCVPAGNVGEGGRCESDPFSCKPGTLCLGDQTQAFCYRRCDMGYTCFSSAQSCVQGDGFAYCDPLATEPQPGNPSDGLCDLRRGNWDCPNGEGCVDDGDGDDIGACEWGMDGDKGSGGLCDDGSDCASGLCDRGVCTVPCEAGCRDGYECDEEAIPGGLCRPESCRESEGGICQDGWICTYTDERRYVCAAEGKPAFGGGLFCACAASRHGVPAALALLVVAGLFFGRRRPCGCAS